MASNWTFTSDPSDANVLINGVLRGVTPLTIRLSSGSYIVSVEKEWVIPRTGEVVRGTGGESISVANMDQTRHYVLNVKGVRPEPIPEPVVVPEPVVTPEPEPVVVPDPIIVTDPVGEPEQLTPPGGEPTEYPYWRIPTAEGNYPSSEAEFFEWVRVGMYEERYGLRWDEDQQKVVSTLKGLTQDDLWRAIHFMIPLVLTKTVTKGIENGKLPDLIERYGKALFDGVMKNPEILVYAGLGYLGLKMPITPEGTEQGWLIDLLMPIVAYRLAQSGSEFVGVPAAIVLGTYGFRSLGFKLVETIGKTVEELKDYVFDQLNMPDMSREEAKESLNKRWLDTQRLPEGAVCIARSLGGGVYENQVNFRTGRNTYVFMDEWGFCSK